MNPRRLQSDGGIILEYLLFIYCVLVLQIDLCTAYERVELSADLAAVMFAADYQHVTTTTS